MLHLTDDERVSARLDRTTEAAGRVPNAWGGEGRQMGGLQCARVAIWLLR